MEGFQGHLTRDWIVPGEISEPKKTENKKAGENQNPINQTFLRGEVHEDQRHQSGLERRHDDRDRDIELSSAIGRNVHVEEPGKETAEIDVGERDGQKSEEKQQATDH